uniref:Integrase catalytic domain-containing protein n=1 Tax=Lutzomyia longipalpis TaxID=7200 RepID=A0A1B0CJJ0_LUTLO
MKKITAAETIRRLDGIFTRLGYPHTITLDNAKQFVSGEFEEYCKEKGIKLNNTTPYWPQENGEVERQNRSLLKRIRISHNTNRDWKQDLNEYLMMYYTTPHSTTGKTPTELCYGRTIRSKIPGMRDVAEIPPSTDYRDQDLLRKEKGKEGENKRRNAGTSGVQVGDTVLMQNLLPGNKLQSNFGRTLYEVKRKEGATATVEDRETGRQFQRNVAHLKKYVGEERKSDEVTEQQEERRSSSRVKRPRAYPDYVVPEVKKNRKERKGCGSERTVQ